MQTRSISMTVLKAFSDRLPMGARLCGTEVSALSKARRSGMSNYKLPAAPGLSKGFPSVERSRTAEADAPQMT